MPALSWPGWKSQGKTALRGETYNCQVELTCPELPVRSPALRLFLNFCGVTGLCRLVWRLRIGLRGSRRNLHCEPHGRG